MGGMICVLNMAHSYLFAFLYASLLVILMNVQLKIHENFDMIGISLQGSVNGASRKKEKKTKQDKRSFGREHFRQLHKSDEVRKTKDCDHHDEIINFDVTNDQCNKT